MRKVKVLALAFVAVCALSAVAAAAASANYHIESATGGSISGSQVVKNEFFTKVGTVKCNVATFTGSQATETATELTVQPTYEKCTLAGQSVEINTAACHYTFKQPTTTTTGTTDAQVEVCSSGGVITIKDKAGLGCVVEVGKQTVSQVMFTNESGKVLVTAEAKGIHYNYTAGCPNSGGSAGSGTEGEYVGTVLVTGTAPISVT